MVSRRERIQAIIATLNAIEIGEVGAIDGKLELVCGELAALDASELEAVVKAARQALARGDVAEFRRFAAQSTARLGHLK